MFRLVCRIGLVCAIGWNCSTPVAAQLFLRPENAFDKPADPCLMPRHELLRAFAEAKDQIDEKDYPDAIRNLQRILDEPEDYFLRPVRGGVVPPVKAAEQGGLTTLKREAQRLLAELPDDGQKAYELLRGISSGEAIAEAQKRDDVATVEALVRQAPSTAAGLAARRWLADRAFDDGRFLAAARTYEELAALPLAGELKPALTARAAFAAWQGGQREQAARLIREARSSAGPVPLKLAGREVDWFDRPEQATNWLQQTAPPVGRNETPAVSWTMNRGDADRNAVAAEVSPAGGEQWRISTLAYLRPDVSPEWSERVRELLQQQLQAARDSLQADRAPAIPSAQPLVVGDRIVYRTVNDVTAVDAASGALAWRGALANPDVQQAVRSLESAVVLDENKLDDFEPLLRSVLKTQAFQDGAAGILSSDGRFVYALEEPRLVASSNVRNLRVATEQLVNRLVAYDLSGGRIAWEIGGARSQQDPVYSGSWFLGAPLPVNDLLYVLSEVAGEIRLLCLSSSEQGVELLWSQQLMGPDQLQEIGAHPFRRWTHLSPAWSEGLLVCPTSAGAVVCVEPAGRMLRWMYEYESQISVASLAGQPTRFDGAPRPNQGASPEDAADRWQDEAVLIAGNRVVLTPCDSTLLHCVDLDNGELLWSRPREEGLYVAAVHDGLILIVGRGAVWTARLEDGSDGWEEPLPIPLPSGRGLNLGDRYLLPLSTGELLTLDVGSGRILARSRLADQTLPGNLAAGQGRLVSLSAGELSAFTPLADLELQIAAGLQQDPRDAASLARRGELRLHRGDEAGGVQDLRDSLAVKSDQHVKSVLAGVMLEAIKADFERNRGLAAEIEALTAPGPQRDQFLRLLAENFERRGEGLEALRAYLRLAQHAGFEERLESLTPDWSVLGDRVVRSRIQTLLAGLSADDRAVARREIQELLASAASQDREPAELQRWLRLLGDLPEVAPFRLQAAEAMSSEEPGLASSLAWAGVARSPVPELSGPAVARLAARSMDHRRFDAAQAWIQKLTAEFSDQVCLDGKTGRQLAELWRADPDFQAATSGPPAWPTGAAELQRVAARNPQVFRRSMRLPVLSQSDEYHGWSFELEVEAGEPKLQARNARGEPQWATSVPSAEGSMPFGMNSLDQVFVRLRGDFLLLVLETHMVAFDTSAPGDPRKLWVHSLMPRRAGEGGQRARIVRTAQGRLMYRNSPGDVLGVTADAVIYGIGRELGALDLLTGRTEWIRYDVPPWTSSFVDDGQILLQFQQVAVTPDGAPLQAYRVADGAPLPPRRLPGGVVLWSEGCRVLLRSQHRPEGQTWQLVNLASGETEWTRDVTATGRPWVEDQPAEILVVDAAGELSAWGLADGQPRWDCQLPVTFAADAVPVLLAQRQGDRLLLLCGIDSQTQIRVFPDNAQQQVAMDATAIMLDAATHAVRWQTPLGWNSFDPGQAPWSPILAAASRQFQLAGPVPGQRLATVILDKRNGQKLYESTENSAASNLTLGYEPGSRDLTLQMMNWSYRIQFADETP